MALPAAWRKTTPDLLWLAAAQPGAIVLQALLGGAVVVTKLNPALVSVHFLASVALLAATVGLYVRCQEGPGPAVPLVPSLVRLAGLGVVGAIALMIAAGTVVTGTGPLAGAAGVARYHLPLEGVTQLHADIGWLLAGLMVALLLGLRLTAAPRKAVRLGWLLLGLIGLQGVVGYTQYFTHLPAGLVWFHVAGSMAIWITALLLPYALRDRGSIADPRTRPRCPQPQAAPPEPAPPKSLCAVICDGQLSRSSEPRTPSRPAGSVPSKKPFCAETSAPPGGLPDLICAR